MGLESKPTGHVVWDIPTRLFHWLLVLAVMASWATSELEMPEYHSWSGYLVVTLLLFRLGWGLVGSRHSRFSDFLRGPATVFAYLKGNESSGTPGHNPAGGWSVILLLGLLAAQVGTGLFLTDEVTFDGPLYALIDDSTAESLAEIHEILFNVLLAAVGLHLAAILFYWKVRGQNLLAAMLTGGDRGQAAPVAWWLGVLLMLICAAVLYGLLQIAPVPNYDF